MQKENTVILSSRLLFIVVALSAPIYGIGMNSTKQVAMGSYYIVAVTAMIALAITYIPEIMYQRKIVALPIKLQEFIAIFTVLAMFFGEIMNFYDRFVWWDSMLHFFSGIMLSLIGSNLYQSLSGTNTNSSQHNPIVAIAFAVLFAIACGAVWEIIEFAGDSLLGMNMQRWQVSASEQYSALQSMSNLSNPGLVNTMKDIICDVIGSLCSIFFMLPSKNAGIFNR
jgi:hypothetical protein